MSKPANTMPCTKNRMFPYIIEFQQKRSDFALTLKLYNSQYYIHIEHDICNRIDITR